MVGIGLIRVHSEIMGELEEIGISHCFKGCFYKKKKKTKRGGNNRREVWVDMLIKMIQ